MNYKASLDTTAKIVTIGVTVLFACLIIWPLFEIKNNGVTSAIYVPAILLVVYFACWIYSPKSYAVSADAITIKRPIGNIVIPKQHIKSVEVPEKGMPFAVRTFGVGGLFGYFGTFYNFDSGNMNWYITNRNNTVLITTSSGKKIVVSPDEKDAFVAALV